MNTFMAVRIAFLIEFTKVAPDTFYMISAMQHHATLPKRDTLLTCEKCKKNKYFFPLASAKH
jgi:hypothetical protein